MRKLSRRNLLFTPLAMVIVVVVALLVFAKESLPAKETVMVPMRDGVKLATDIYLPGQNKKYPVLLVRTPYDKIANAPLAASAISAGVALVAQDSRGRVASEGANIPFDGDGWWGPTDGLDTVEWILKQEWCNGKIGTFGGSALGIAQLMLAGTGTDKLAFQHISVGCPGLYLDGLTHGGVLRKAIIYDWVTENKFSEDTLKIWMEHDTYDDYWRKRDLREKFSASHAPAVHIGGWYDIFAQGTLDAFVGIQNEGGTGAKGNQKLVMGPWAHTIGAQPVGDVQFPDGKKPPNDAHDPGIWALHYLLDKDTGADKLPAVTYYVMGDTRDPNAPGNCWRDAAQWPPAEAKITPFYFTSDNKLSTKKDKTNGRITYASDPNDPIPTIGGPQLTIPAGMKDQRKIESRKDIVLFTSEPMKEPMEITGKVNVKLWASVDVPDTDLIARLCVVYPDGTSYNICEGALRARLRESLSEVSEIVPGKPYLFDIDLWSTSYVVNKGLRLRVHIAGSSYPAFAVNMNDGSTFGRGDKPKIAHTTILTGPKYPSAIMLPVVK